MNNNIKYYIKGDEQWAEWADRALDDDDRYADDSIIIEASTPIIHNDPKQTLRNVKTKLLNKYNEWILKTRG